MLQDLQEVMQQSHTGHPAGDGYALEQMEGDDVKFSISELDGQGGLSTSPLLPAGATPVSGPKKRRRIHLNCEECRRTKSRCECRFQGLKIRLAKEAIGNRSWPCSECVKKGKPGLPYLLGSVDSGHREERSK